MEEHQLLIIDDEADVASLVAEAATACGFAVRQCHQPDEFKDICKDFQPDVIVLDLGMPKPDGIELLSFLADTGSQARIFIFSGLDPTMLRVAAGLGVARGLNMTGSLAKPVRLSELNECLLALKEACELSQTKDRRLV
ncbi:response regulator transcription factor [Dongia soli]|uniref:Response regulator n=1 Tax=Dongia soli TaxID=600628 RepID=A0ABU5EAN0_9PROT|nr:response regulator [Dongia soli]MDY0882849.1 response regulator [Dongia soli]